MVLALGDGIKLYVEVAVLGSVHLQDGVEYACGWEESIKMFTFSSS